MSGSRTAILLLDFQNEFVKKGGKLHNDVADTMEKTGVLENVPKLVDFARKTDAMIIYSPVVMKETGTLTSSVTRRQSTTFHSTEYSKQYGLFTENTWNCEIIHEVEPRNDDIILRDRSDFSAFEGTKLISELRDNNITHFFIVGFLTDVCVYQTSTAAAKLLPEMSTYVIADGCAAKSLDKHEAALENIATKSVNVVSASEAESIISECAASSKQSLLDGSDDWLMIEKIFSAGGVGRTESMDVEILRSLIESMHSDSSILSTLTDSLEASGEKEISRAQMHKILFQRKHRSGFFENFPLIILMSYLPFLYSVSTRIPFIFIALEITQGRGRELWEVGVVLGTYQVSRALGNLIVVMFGGKDPFKRLQILLSCIALFGWSFLALFGRPSETSPFSFTPYLSETDGGGTGSILPLFALFCVGLGETIVILQRSLMMETAKESPSGIMDESLVAQRFSYQYAFVSFGATCAFIVGGWLYTTIGYYSVCDFGMIIQALHLLGALVYLFLARNSKKSLKGDELDGNDLIRSVIYQFQAASVISKYSQDVANGTEHAMSSESQGLSDAAIKAKSDRVLNHSLGEMYRHFFLQKKDDAACMEELLNSIDSTEATGVNASLTSKRPTAMAIGKHKLSKLVLFLVKSKGQGRLTEREFVSFWAPRIYLSIYESSQEAKSVNVIWPYMRAVVATQAIAALCIGIFLSTALLSYTQRFPERCDAATVGLLLGIGEGAGVLVIFAKSYLSGRKYKESTNNLLLGILKAIVARPLNVPSVLFVASLCSMLFSVDNFAVAVTFQMIYSAVNDLAVSLMNELIGTSIPSEKFKYYQGIGQWLRRLGNMVTAILGPIFFGIDERLPFLFFGAIVFVWAVMIWYLMYMHADRIQQSIAYTSSESDEKDEGENKSCIAESVVEPFVPFLVTSSTPWHVLEQRYYSLNKDRLEEELNSLKKASVDISLMEHRIRRIAAALEVEKDQRRALEDRMYARVSTTESEGTNAASNLEEVI